MNRTLYSIAFFVFNLWATSAVAPLHSACSEFGASQEAERTSASLIQTRGVRARAPVANEWRLVFGVFTSPQPQYRNQLAAVLDTWGKDVAPHQLLVVGVNGSEPGVVYNPASNCMDGNDKNPGLACKEATMLTTGYEMKADWVLVFGSDNYVFAQRFAEELKYEDANIPQIRGMFGCGGSPSKSPEMKGKGLFCDDHKLGLCGGGGYAISRAALEKLIGKGENAGGMFVQEMMHVASTVSGNWSDQTTSCIARRRGIEQVKIKGLYGWSLCDQGTWCPSCERPIRRAMLNTKVRPLTFHYINPTAMHVLHRVAKQIEEYPMHALQKIANEKLPSGWECGWSNEYERLYYFQRDFKISTWTTPPYWWSSPGDENASEPALLNKSEQSSRASFLQDSAAADDGYEAQRARYIQLVEKERSEMYKDVKDSLKRQHAAYVQVMTEEKTETLLDPIGDAPPRRSPDTESFDCSRQAEIVEAEDYETQQDAYIAMLDKERAAMHLSTSNTAD